MWSANSVVLVARFEYPKTPEEARGTQHELAHRLYGSGASEALFGRHLITCAPWPKAGGTKGTPPWNQEQVSRAISSPNVEHVDPRALHSTQAEVTLAGVNYYLTDEYKRTGRTFADIDKPGNRMPMVYTDCSGRNKLLAGHHRATAALINGTQFQANVVRQEGC
jgi:hypothetical protein